MQRFRIDIIGQPTENGSIPCYTEWMGGRPLAAVKKCPCEDGISRTVYMQSEPDTFFSIPAATRIKGRYTKGWVTFDENGFQFFANK